MNRRVSASTQNQALNAIVFMYREVVRRDPGEFGEFDRAKQPKRLPTVLTRDEVKCVLAHLEGTHRLMARLLYGTGIRLMECVRLRIKDVDFTRGTITVRSGKGDKDRVTVLPEALRDQLQAHIERLRGVELPEAFAVKSPNAGTSWPWPWQWVFPARDISRDPRKGSRMSASGDPATGQPGTRTFCAREHASAGRLAVSVASVGEGDASQRGH